MEAVAIYDFEAQSADELSFKKGDRLCTLDVMAKDVCDWVQACKGAHCGLLPTTYIQMEPHPWFLHCDNREQAAEKLLERSSSGKYIHPDGAFIVRKNMKDKTGFSLSVKQGDGDVVHYKVMKGVDKFFIWNVAQFTSVNELVSNYRAINVSADHDNPIYLRDLEPVYEAIYDFKSSCNEELELRRGDIVRFVRESDDSGWGEGEVTGSRGFFPLTYVQQIHPGVWSLH